MSDADKPPKPKPKPRPLSDQQLLQVYEALSQRGHSGAAVRVAMLRKRLEQ